MNTNVSFNLAKPQHLVSLSSAALLVNVEVRVWTATKQNRAVSDEVNINKKASRDSGKFIENLLANDADHKRIINYRQTVYNWLQRIAYDFAGTWRALPHVDLPRFMKEYETHKQNMDVLVETFLQKYPSLISNMAFVQGEMFNRDNYPSVEQIKNKFSIQLYTADIPMHDWRCKISEDLAEDLHNNYSRQVEQIVNNIMTKQAEQVINVLSSVSHCCGVDEVTGKDGEIKIKKRKIFDSTLDKARQLINTFREFNLTNNQELEETRLLMEKTFRSIDAETLRENDLVREQVKNEVDDILSKFRPVSGV